MIPSFGEAVRFWFRLGWLSFGGPAGQISLMHKTLVEEKKWISEDKFSHALNYCMLLPGPEAQQLATYLGWILHGTKGGIFAGLLFILPSILIFIGISTFYYTYGSVSYAISFLNGIKPAILAIIVLTFGKMVRKNLRSNGQKLCFVLTAAAILFFGVSYPVLLLFAGVLGAAACYFEKSKSNISQDARSGEITFKQSNLSDAANVSSEGIDLQTVFDDKRIYTSEILKNLSRAGSVGLILWALPFLGILFFLKTEFAFWKELILFFTKTAFVTFGGAYAILPTVADFATRQAGWIRTNEMIDGLAFGESTPGPLVMVLTFVGFLAGAHRFGTIGAGVFGLLLTAYYTFLPSFLLILGGAALVEKTKESEFFRIVLSYVTACVCGVIFYLAVFFANSILFKTGATWGSWFQNPLLQTNWLPLFWTMLGVFFLIRKKEYSIFWIFFSGAVFLGAETFLHL
ncbi:chromate transporter [Leptospira yasudae]|uniref:chromate efflux transporter n=1 Tax=Leptospira yasudae TaxID=2202201 RepID=UPI0010830D87|nr:chromate transporter [Leptospira yasudae]TGK27853.1 chromate transporter [Leptospira yasudae]TGM06978.1 chromate transporter [Leptospira yasudae]